MQPFIDTVYNTACFWRPAVKLDLSPKIPVYVLGITVIAGTIWVAKTISFTASALFFIPAACLVIYIAMRLLRSSNQTGANISKISLTEELKAKKNQESQQLRVFYENKKITTGNELIVVEDLNSLGLNSEDKCTIRTRISGTTIRKTVTLREAAEDVIAEINRLIQQNTSIEIQRKRCVLIGYNEEPFKTYHEAGLPTSQMTITAEEQKQLWMHRIINALIEHGHIFKLVDQSYRGYKIQA